MVRRGGLVANSAGPRSVGPYAPEMADPMTQLPADAVESGAERPMLEWFLSYYRAVLARKLEGVSEAGARRMACPPSDLSLIGLVRHMAEVERVWASRNFTDGDHRWIFCRDAHPDGHIDGELHPPPEATVAEALDAYWREIAEANAIYATAELDDIGVGQDQQHSLRWILVHLIEEYARHCGHADLLRQAVDGRTGD